MTTTDVYTWICLRLDSAGLFTAELRQNNETIETLGGSYPRARATELDATSKWGRDIPVHWEGFEVPEISGVIEVHED